MISLGLHTKYYYAMINALRNERSCMRPPPSNFARSKNSLLVIRLRVPLAPCCGPGDMEVFASRAPELCRCDAGVGTSRYGDLEACCGCRDVGVFATRAPELWRCDAGIGTSRCGDLEACCGCRDVASKEVGRCAAGVLPLFASRAPEL